VIELLAIVVATTLGLGALASGAPSAYREYREDLENKSRKEKELERQKKLYQIRARMKLLSEQSPSPSLEDEYDRLELEERILLADELEPVPAVTSISRRR
jgi:hypothetical protein